MSVRAAHCISIKRSMRISFQASAMREINDRRPSPQKSTSSVKLLLFLRRGRGDVWSRLLHRPGGLVGSILLGKLAPYDQDEKRQCDDTKLIIDTQT